ncbi:MAG: GAF domain-containing protein, partial [Myxococcales bacterium]|nr:GAF domain-containing protein [Myxococcales bacterium]
STPPTGRVCLTIVLFVERTGEDIILDDALADGEFVDDPYIRERGIRSILCTPVSHKGLILGILYLEHREAPGVFTLPRVALLKHLASQVAISVENARLYRRLDSALDRALAADKAKARFLLTMSHELRTPLNAVLGYTDLIAESIEDGDLDSADEDLERIREGATRLVRTLTSVL